MLPASRCTGLREFYQQVILSGACQDAKVEIAPSAKRDDWPKRLQDNLGKIVSPYSTTGNAEHNISSSP
jgi:hypothetical protein